MNFFQPIQKLERKVRTGTRVRRVYDRAQTPDQRVCATGILSPAARAQLDAALERLWPLATSAPIAHGEGEESTGARP